MSRIAKNPVVLPKGVEITLGADEITVKGPLGTLRHFNSTDVRVAKDGDAVQVTAAHDTIQSKAMSGTMRAVINNMVKGVSAGFEKKLTLVGVGYRAAAKGDVLNLALGFSHPVDHKVPAGIKVETPSQTEIIIKGADKQVVGQVAADIRAYRPPEPYKGKGVRYADETVAIKETKKK